MSNYNKKNYAFEQVITDLSTYCDYCGHSEFMEETKAKKPCGVCGCTVYNKNDLGQKQKFMDELKATTRRLYGKQNKHN